jgi:hypothetical protein
MKNYSGCDICRLAGLWAMVCSVVLGVIFSFLLTGFGLIFFGVTFFIGLVVFSVGLALRRFSARVAASS